MPTTRSQKRKNIQQENSENVSDGFVSPVVVEYPCFSEQDVVPRGLRNQNPPGLKIAFWKV